MTNYDEQKFAEMVLYVCQRCQFDRYFGATKLNKYLFFADFAAYQRTANPISGAEYQRLPNGPAPRKILPVRDRLVRDGALKPVKVDAGSGFTEDRLIPLREPDLTRFSATEIAIIDEVIDTYRDYKAVELSKHSHRHDGWRLAGDSETIPYFTELLPHGNDQIPERVIEHGRSLADAARSA